MPTSCLTDCMAQSHFWEANTHSSRLLNKFPALLKYKFHDCANKILPLVRILNQPMGFCSPPVPVTSVLILSSIYMCFFQMDSFLQLSHHKGVYFNPHTCHMPGASHPAHVPTLLKFAKDCIHKALRYSVFSILTINFCLPSQLPSS